MTAHPQRRHVRFDRAYDGVPALVLGATGFIGAWVARALGARGAIVSVAVRDTARASAAFASSGRKVSVIGVDLARPGEATHAIEVSRPAVVFNLAGYGVDRAERDPAAMTSLNANLVDELCRRLAGEPDRGWKGVRLIHAGSALEYGLVSGPLHEGVAPNPTTDYGRTKLRGTRHIETCCAASGLPAVVARLFTVYGPGEHADRLLPSLARVGQTGHRLGLTAGRQRRDFTYVEDVAEGLLRLGASAARPGEVVNLGMGRLTSVREFAETAADVLGFDARLLEFGALPERDEEMWHGNVEIGRLTELTSWSPSTALADGIRRSSEFIHVH